MSFDTYSGPSPWDNTNPKKNPFDTDNNTGTHHDTSAFDTKEEGSINDTSTFNTDSKFIKYNPNKKHFDATGTLSNRSFERRISAEKRALERRLAKIKLEKEIKLARQKLAEEIRVHKEEKARLLQKINEERIREIEKFQLLQQTKSKDENKDNKKVETNDIKQKNIVDKAFYEDEKITKEKILQKDKDWNEQMTELLKTNTRDQVINILEGRNKLNKREDLNINKEKIKPLSKNDYFIKYDRKEILNNKRDRIVGIALNAFEHRDHLRARHCTDWINKVYLKATGRRVYDSNTLFNGVKRIAKGTGIGVQKYATNDKISAIQPGDHIMVDKPIDGKYGVGKTHSVLALGTPNNGIVKVISYTKYNTPPVVEYYDLYGKGRAKSGKPIRIQRAA